MRWTFRSLVGMALVTGPMVQAEARRVDKKVPPAYPELARRMHITGKVEIAVTIAPDGSVTDVKTVNGNQLLSGAAEDAVKKWKFEQADAASKETIEITFADGN